MLQIRLFSRQVYSFSGTIKMNNFPHRPINLIAKKISAVPYKLQYLLDTNEWVSLDIYIFAIMMLVPCRKAFDLVSLNHTFLPLQTGLRSQILTLLRQVDRELSLSSISFEAHSMSIVQIILMFHVIVPISGSPDVDVCVKYLIYQLRRLT